MNMKTEILKLWQSRGENERTGSDAEKVADIAWVQGLRLHPQRNIHHDRVKYLIGHCNIG
ncbi:TPA: hypothetical protein LTW91_001246 [Enterobacter hormaechei]|nr:hypothetical protein [Enterobacter hormaechei]EKJ6982148.1 hypothetical protein [Enterobacter hormaechei]PIA04909.1 hypothetical protein CS906_20855 [Enterobacter cloacae]HBL9018155.1 hypothetical protein [Enterobacter hormaechei]HCT2216945.1 hypothetical protein [Enterobacter hormaechei]